MCAGSADQQLTTILCHGVTKGCCGLCKEGQRSCFYPKIGIECELDNAANGFQPGVVIIPARCGNECTIFQKMNGLTKTIARRWRVVFKGAFVIEATVVRPGVDMDLAFWRYGHLFLAAAALWNLTGFANQQPVAIEGQRNSKIRSTVPVLLTARVQSSRSAVCNDSHVLPRTG